MKIVSLGVELEGGIDDSGLLKLERWITKHNLSPYFDYGGDASVEVEDKEHEDYELRFWNPKPSIVYQFINESFNSGLDQNDTCGNHVHYRFSNMELAIAFITHKLFWDRFRREYINKFPEHKYLARLGNSYCAWKYSLEEKYLFCEQGHSERYRAINLDSVHESQRTIEVRVLPYAVTAQELIGAIKKLNSMMTKLLAKFNTSIGLSAKDIPIGRVENQEVERCALKQSYLTKKDLVNLDTEYSLTH
jgi:hypothetical protein